MPPCRAMLFLVGTRSLPERPPTICGNCLMHRHNTFISAGMQRQDYWRGPCSKHGGGVRSGYIKLNRRSAEAPSSRPSASAKYDCQYVRRRRARTIKLVHVIVRIAIVPELHHQGLGHLLLSFIEGDLRQSQVAVIGTSFGAHAALLAFWQSANYRTIKLGSKRDHVSGEHSALMVKSLNPLGCFECCDSESELRALAMPLLLSRCFNDRAPKVNITASLKEAPTRPLTEALDKLCLTRFVNNEIPLNLCYGALYRAIAGNWSLLF